MILIADDDRVYDDELKRALQDAGFQEVGIATTGKDALSIATGSYPPAVIILDMMIPYEESDFADALPPAPGEEARGARIARELRDKGYDLSRIVVITALCQEVHLAPLRKLGITRIFTKPALTRDILATVRLIHASKEPIR